MAWSSTFWLTLIDPDVMTLARAHTQTIWFRVQSHYPLGHHTCHIKLIIIKIENSDNQKCYTLLSTLHA